jgi:hypothetical protein
VSGGKKKNLPRDREVEENRYKIVRDNYNNIL